MDKYDIALNILSAQERYERLIKRYAKMVGMASEDPIDHAAVRVVNAKMQEEESNLVRLFRQQ